MRKNILSVIRAFLRRECKNERTCSTDGSRIYSYNMMIVEALEDGTVWIASERESPSRTTTSQLRACRFALSHLTESSDSHASV